MAKPQQSPFPCPAKRIYFGAAIPPRLIRRYAQAIAEEFHPDKIILFGSHAYGTPNEDSDVDLLVVMPASNPHSQAVRILWRLAAPFPIDLIVRTPKEMKWRLEEGESFLTTIVSQGKVLYEKDNQRTRKGEETSWTHATLTIVSSARSRRRRCCAPAPTSSAGTSRRTCRPRAPTCAANRWLS